MGMYVRSGKFSTPVHMLMEQGGASMNKRQRVWDHWMERMDLPGESSPQDTIVEMHDDSRVLVENHRGICEYGNCRIRIRVRYGEVVICGHALKLSRMSDRQLIVSGSIDQLLLNKRRNQ